MTILSFRRQEDLSKAVSEIKRCLGEGCVALIPTETFYGLACDPWSEEGVGRVLRLKDRPRNMALPVLAANWSQVDRLTCVPEKWRARLEALWPGPVTAVLPTRADLPAALPGTVAVRIPGHPLLRQLLVETGPLTGTSANRHGDPPATDMAAALRSLAGEPDIALDGGPTSGGLPSTLVDLSGGEARILRQGPEAWDPSV